MARSAPPTSPLLAQAAQAAVHGPDRLAAVLQAYRVRHWLSEPALASWLGCSLLQLHGLALCRRPAAGRTAFDADVQAIAAGIGCDADRLTMLLQEVAAPEIELAGREPA